MIIILTQCFPSRMGGIESLISNLALGLSKTEKVVVLADTHDILNDALYDNKYKNQILVKRIGGIKYFRRRQKIKQTKLLIESNQVKFVIGDSWKSLELGIDYLCLNKIPTICLAHGNELLSKRISKIKKFKTVLKKTSLIIANSQYTKSLVQSLDVPATKVDYIYPGAFDLRNENEIKLSNIEGSPIVLTLARIEKRKGHFYVINSIKKLLIKYPNIRYVIAGEGPEKKFLEKLVLEYNLSKNISFVGQVNNGQKKYLFERADLMIMPTIDESFKNSIEGFGISYLEAAFFSIPSIASNIGGTSEAVIDNETGIIINNIDALYDSILDLLVDNEKKNKLGKAAQKRADKEFQWKIIIEKHLSIYKKYNII